MRTEQAMVQALKEAVQSLADLMTEADAMGLATEFNIQKVEPAKRFNRPGQVQFAPVVFKVTKDLTKETGA